VKNSSLYPSEFIDKIVDRNTEYYNQIDAMQKSLKTGFKAVGKSHKEILSKL
jgi:hypothetical protein